MKTRVTLARTEEEKRAVYRFRYRVYVDELGCTPPGADREHREVRDELDEVASSYLLSTDGEAVGSLRVVNLADVPDLARLKRKFTLGPALEQFEPREIVTTSRFMLHPRLRHGKAILALMRKAYEDARGAGARLNYGDCSPHLVPLYEHLGYRRYGPAFNDPDFGYKLPILMLMGDAPAFERVRSPLARLAQRLPEDPEAGDWFEKHYPAYSEPGSAALLTEGRFLDLLAERVGESPVHHLSLLKGLTPEEAQRFLAEAVVIESQPGDRIVRQGERDETLYAMLDGIADVLLDELPDRPINIVGSGDTFGEIGLLGTVPRTANVVCRSPCEILVLSADFFQRFLRTEPVIAAKVMLNLAHSLAVRLALATSGLASSAPSVGA